MEGLSTVSLGQYRGRALTDVRSEISPTRRLTYHLHLVPLVSAIVLVFGFCALLPGVARAADALASSETVLTTRYAPIAMLKKQSAPCDRSGEQFAPSPVQIVLGNPARSYTAIVLSLLYLDLRSRRDAASTSTVERRRIGRRRHAIDEP